LQSPSPYLKHFCLNRFPFRQQPDPEVFFPEAGRGDVLLSLCADIAGGKPIVRLTGGEGTGKTLLYLLLARKLGIKKYEVVCLDHPVGSFEDLLRIICRSLNNGRDGGPAEGETGRAGAGHLHLLLALLKEKSRAGQRTVFLIDDADQLFMATLERLVRLIVDVGQEQLLQIVLIGRPELDRNLQQLSGYCDHVDIHPGYFLAPFDLQETVKYLRFRLVEAGCDPKKVQEIFSEEAVVALWQAAQGNLSLINLLAEHGLARACESGTFQVEAELVSPPKAVTGKSSPNISPLKTWLLKYKFQALAGSLLVLSLLLVSFWPEGKEVVPPAPPAAQVAADEKSGLLAETEEKQAQVSQTTAKKNPVKSPPAKEKPDADPAVIPHPVPADRSGHRSAVGKEGQQGAAQAKLQADNPASTVSSPLFPAPEAIALSTPVPALAEQHPISPRTEKGWMDPSAEPDKNIIVLQPEERKRKSAAAAKETKQPAAKTTNDPEQLFAERMKASSRWRSKSGFTIQLMALASETADENFKTLLSQERYAAMKDQLYLVRKASPPTLFVYYGFFETMEKARQERERLPDFLRKNQPYPLSVEQALKKAKN